MNKFEGNSSKKGLCGRIIQYVKEPWKSIVAFDQHIASVIPDRLYVSARFRAMTGYPLDLNNPRTFNEKVQWYKLYYRDPQMTYCADKYLAKEYVEKCDLNDLITPIIGVWDRAEDIEFEMLPDECFIKCNHNSNGAIHWRREMICDKSRIISKLDALLKKNGYHANREWAYKNIRPVIFAEEMIESREDEPLIDWNVFCFNGKPRLILYNIGLVNSKGEHSDSAYRASLDTQFNYLNIETALKTIPEEEIEKPAFWEEMLEYACILSKPFPQVRVDFFSTGKTLRFGELTFYSSGGYAEWKPEKWGAQMGEWFILPKKLL